MAGNGLMDSGPMAGGQLHEGVPLPGVDEVAGSPGEDFGEPASASDAASSTIENVEALFGDVLNYLDAEMAFQSSRLRFAGQTIKLALGAGVLALVLVSLAAFGLVFGLILALTPLITAWGATAVVVGLLLLGAYLLVRKAAASVRLMKAEVRDKPGAAQEEPDHV